MVEGASDWFSGERQYSPRAVKPEYVGNIGPRGLHHEIIETFHKVGQCGERILRLLVVERAAHGVAVEFPLQGTVYSGDVFHHLHLYLEKLGDTDVGRARADLLRQWHSGTRAIDYDAVEPSPFVGYVVDVGAVGQRAFRKQQHAFGRCPEYPVIHRYQPVGEFLLVDYVTDK